MNGLKRTKAIMLLTSTVVILFLTMLGQNMLIDNKEAIENNKNMKNQNKSCCTSTPTSVTTQTVAPTTLPVAQPKFKERNVPLSRELQKYTWDLCQKRNLDFEIVLALMSVESSFREKIISRTNDYGIMQINRCNHKWLREDLGITNFLDAKQNINAGTYMLSLLNKKYSNIHKVLMSYNFGETRAKRIWNNGKHSSVYSRKVVSVAKKIKNK